MTINKIITQTMKAEGVKQSEMANALGMKRTTNVSARLNKSNLTFDSALEMLDVIDYEIVVRKKQEHNEDDYVVTGSVEK